MLICCETKSTRVKGLAFHPRLSWLLASLHNGSINLWDYRVGALLDKFEEHEGPVRGVDFHKCQPLFASGGDDNLVKVWNYKQKRCLFSLQGHMDYVRTVQFHFECPWILSASDDCTMRIWNWQSRSCIAILPGHNHYVMCAQFHPSQDLIVSASLDHSIRIWSFTQLKEKSGPSIGFERTSPSNLVASSLSEHFGVNDVVVKHVLEGHERGVNWATFHPTSNMVASGSDDRQVKLWRYGDIKAWEVDTLRGHSNNVSCVMFHPKRDLLLSNSEDRTIRVWDVTKRQPIHTFRRESDRFWILAGLQNSNLVAVGHDEGFVVFKLDRERPAADVHKNTIYYVSPNRDLIVHDLESHGSTTMASLRRPTSALVQGPARLLFNHYNEEELNMISFYKDGDSRYFDLISCPNNSKALLNPGKAISIKGGIGRAAVFVARNRFAVLESHNSIVLYNMASEVVKRVDLPGSMVAQKMFEVPSVSHLVLLRCDDKILLFNTNTKETLFETSSPPGGVSRVCWSLDYKFVALMARNTVIITTSSLEPVKTIQEHVKIKSGVWDANGVFYYSTYAQTKYATTFGDTGIIGRINGPVYFVRVQKNTCHFFDTSGNLSSAQMNSTETIFKLALHQKQMNIVTQTVKEGRLCGNGIIGYLWQKGYPDVAMQFVSDPLTRLNLCLELGDLEEAFECANRINQKSSWKKVSETALKLGRFDIAKKSMQQSKDVDSLALLYLCSGSTGQVKKLLKIAELRQDIMSRMHLSLFLGEVEKRVEILKEVGHSPLAAITAAAYGLDSKFPELEDSVKLVEEFIDENKSNRLNFANTPVLTKQQLEPWPLNDKKLTPEGSMATEKTTKHLLESYVIQQGVEDDDFDVYATEPYFEAHEIKPPPDISSAWDVDNLDIDDLVGPTEVKDSSTPVLAKEIEPEVTRESYAKRIISRNPLPVDYVVAGKFSDALKLLNTTLGLKSSAPLKDIMLEIYRASSVDIHGLPFLPHMTVPLLHLDSEPALDKGPLRPRILVTIDFLKSMLQKAKMKFRSGEFSSCLSIAKDALRYSIFYVDALEIEETTLESLVKLFRDYITVTRMRLEAPDGDPKALELAFQSCFFPLEATDQFLLRRKTVVDLLKAGNFLSGHKIAILLLSSLDNVPSAALPNGPTEVKEKFTKILTLCESKGKDSIQLENIENIETSETCVFDFKRLQPWDQPVKCALCHSFASSEKKGEVCPTCGVCAIGADSLKPRFSR